MTHDEIARLVLDSAKPMVDLMEEAADDLNMVHAIAVTWQMTFIFGLAAKGTPVATVEKIGRKLSDGMRDEVNTLRGIIDEYWRERTHHDEG